MGTVDQFADLWTERRPEPLVMTDTEILDWLNEWCVEINWNRATPESIEEFVIHCDDLKTSGRTLREAVQLAAAKIAEVY
jgi:hypothetical protein